MKILGIESSGVAASCALFQDEKMLGVYTQCHEKTHSEKLMPLIVKLLEDNEIKVNEIDAIAVSKGPGSYTGLRIGAAIGKGLAQALNVPIISVPTIMAIAGNVFDVSRFIIPILDAKSERVYSGVYKWDNGSLTTVKSQFATEVDELIDYVNSLNGEFVFCGDGAIEYEEKLRKNVKKKFVVAPIKYGLPSAETVTYIGYKLFVEGKSTSCYEFSPEYLRPSQAERTLKEKH